MEPFRARLGGTLVVFGAGELARLGELARARGARRVLLVTDPGVSAAGHAGRAVDSLRAAGLEFRIFDEVVENPTTRHVEAGTAVARAAGIELIVGLGGGSAMDCAKGINFLVSNGGRIEDYWGEGKAAKPMLPSIGVPTTAGTGSEAQSFALIEQEGTLRKMACGDEKVRFATVILDSDLTATQPRRVAALTAMDAVSHVVESFVTTRRNPVSRLLSREAWRLLSEAFPAAMEDSPDESTRGHMLLGAHLAGCAIEASMLGAAHAMANPLTSDFGVPHGEAVMLGLPHVVRFNEPVAGAWYRELSDEPLAARLEAMRSRAGLATRLRDAGVPASALAGLASQAASQWTAGFNPRPVSEADLRGLYESAW